MGYVDNAELASRMDLLNSADFDISSFVSKLFSTHVNIPEQVADSIIASMGRMKSSLSLVDDVAVTRSAIASVDCQVEFLQSVGSMMMTSGDAEVIKSMAQFVSDLRAALKKLGWCRESAPVMVKVLDLFDGRDRIKLQKDGKGLGHIDTPPSVIQLVRDCKTLEEISHLALFISWVSQQDMRVIVSPEVMEVLRSLPDNTPMEWLPLSGIAVAR